MLHTFLLLFVLFLAVIVSRSCAGPPVQGSSARTPWPAFLPWLVLVLLLALAAWLWTGTPAIRIS